MKLWHDIVRYVLTFLGDGKALQSRRWFTLRVVAGVILVARKNEHPQALNSKNSNWKKRRYTSSSRASRRWKFQGKKKKVHEPKKECAQWRWIRIAQSCLRLWLELQSYCRKNAGRLLVTVRIKVRIQCLGWVPQPKTRSTSSLHWNLMVWFIAGRNSVSYPQFCFTVLHSL